MIWLAGLPVIWWVAILLADAIQPGRNLFELMEVLTEKLNHPFQFHYTEYTIKSMLVCTLLYAAGIGIFYSSQKNYRRGEEHGSARWGDARQICKKYSQKPYSQNILLTQNFRISLDTHKHRRCLNILVVGGSGAGKSRGFALPNIMQCCCSMVITDPKAELLRKTGGLLEKKGYEVRVFDLINPDTSFCYNPFEYVHDDKDVLRLISNLIQNTTPKGSQSSDPFWEKSETALLQALMLYLLHEAPPEEQNFAMIMEMLGSAQVKEEDEDYESPLDILFDRLEMRDPDSIAVKQYHIYKQAAGKTAKSILISVGVRLAAFNLPQIAKLTNTDELDLSNMGERKVALFCCIPDADTSLNYLVGMIYSQLFQTLYYMADRVHGGALPVPVNCIMDEFPNVSLPNEFEKILATCRSRSIYCSIIIQNMSQLKALFKDSWESLVGNCDEFLYLGGNEKETHKYVSELLGKETIDTNTYGQTKGKSGSYSTNFQQSGRELLQPDEVRMLDNQNALLFIRGERPILDAKYDLMKHPNIRYTEDGGAGPFNYAKAPLAHDDFTFDETRYDDYELLLDEDIIGELFDGRNANEFTENKKHTEIRKETAPLKMKRGQKKLFALYAVTVLSICIGATCVYAAGDPLTVVNNLSTFIFSLIRAIGLILLGFGIVQVGLSLKSHDPSQRANGFLTLAGGIIITFAKEILDLIMG